MTTATVERFGSGVSDEKLIEALDRDGCAIVEGALSSEQLKGMNADLEALIEWRNQDTHRSEPTNAIKAISPGHGLRLMAAA